MITGILSIKSGKATISPSANAKINSIPVSMTRSILSKSVSTKFKTAFIATGINSGNIEEIPCTKETTT